MYLFRNRCLYLTVLFVFLPVDRSLSIHGAEKRTQIYHRRNAASHQPSQRPSVVRHSSFLQGGKPIKMEASSSGSVILPALIGKPVTDQPGNFIYTYIAPVFPRLLLHKRYMLSNVFLASDQACMEINL